jgi:hypothetical protein
MTELFTLDDLDQLGKAPLGPGSRVRLPGGSTGVVVARDPKRRSIGLWWLVKLTSGPVVTAQFDSLDVLS